MSVNVYLKGEKVKEVKGFEVIEYRGEDGSSRKRHRLPGLDLYHSRGRWYFMLDEPTALIPSVVADIVEEISFREWIPLIPNRETGVYRYESAEAEVEMDRIGGTEKYHVHIRAKKMEDLRELFRRIRIGSIRPVESYEGEQNGMSRVQLEQELERLQTKKANRFSRCTRWLGRFIRKI